MPNTSEERRLPRPGRVRVQGSASGWAPADHADVTFAVRKKGATGSKAVALASEDYQLLDAALSDAGDVIVRRTTVALTVTPVTRWDPETGKEIREGFSAARSETVRFSPPSAAGAVLRAISIAVPELTLTGPDYGLSHDNPIHDTVRREASADARRAAASYAEGLGAALGRVVKLTEPGLSGGGSGFGPEPRMAVMSAAAKQGEDSDGAAATLVEIVDEDIEVRASIVIEFELAS